jgi:hypothetical protein
MTGDPDPAQGLGPFTDPTLAGLCGLCWRLIDCFGCPVSQRKLRSGRARRGLSLRHGTRTGSAPLPTPGTGHVGWSAGSRRRGRQTVVVRKLVPPGPETVSV